MRSLLKRSIKGVGVKLQTGFAGWLEAKVRKQSLVGHSTFFDTNLFPWIAEIEANWRDVRNELDQVLQSPYIPAFQEVSKDQLHLTRDQNWKAYVFSIYGHDSQENRRSCPRTVDLLDKIPGMKTAFFSILAPGKHIPEHRGPYNGVLRLHLALRVPKDRMNCKIRVGSDYGYWEEGKALVFDDSHLHEVWNNTDEQRVVMFIDFLRPLPPFTARLNEWFIEHIAASKFIQDAVGNLKNINARIAAGDHAS